MVLKDQPDDQITSGAFDAQRSTAHTESPPSDSVTREWLKRLVEVLQQHKSKVTRSGEREEIRVRVDPSISEKNAELLVTAMEKGAARGIRVRIDIHDTPSGVQARERILGILHARRDARSAKKEVQEGPLQRAPAPASVPPRAFVQEGSKDLGNAEHMLREQMRSLDQFGTQSQNFQDQIRHCMATNQEELRGVLEECATLRSQISEEMRMIGKQNVSRDVPRLPVATQETPPQNEVSSHFITSRMQQIEEEERRKQPSWWQRRLASARNMFRRKPLTQAS